MRETLEEILAELFTFHCEFCKQQYLERIIRAAEHELV